MATVEVTLPDELVSKARAAGLLASDNVEQLLREQLRKRRIDELFEATKRMHDVEDSARLSSDEMAAEIRAVRAEQRSAASE
jgi:hypothetical protein